MNGIIRAPHVLGILLAGLMLVTAPFAHAQKKALELKRVEAKRVGVPGGGQDRWLQITADFCDSTRVDR